MSDYAHGPLDERAILMRAVQAAGGEVVYSSATADAVLYRVRFHPAAVGKVQAELVSESRCRFPDWSSPAEPA
jgi:hypothetical protein